MIGGYVLPSRESRSEKIFKKNSTIPLQELIIESEDYVGWFFHTFDKQRSYNNVYYDDTHLLLIDGIAVTGNSKEGYRLFEPQKDFSGTNHTAFLQCLNKIVSNVNIIAINRYHKGLTVNFASHRASGGRIWYMKTQNKKGLILCDDFRPLLNFSRFEIEPKAIYAILKYGASPDPITIIKNIYSVPASHFATCTIPNFNIKSNPFFHFDFSEANNCNIKPTKDVLQKSAQFLGSIDTLLLLSGGVDSTLLAHYLNSHGGIDAFYLSFGRNDPELIYAKEAAKKAGINLNTFYMEGEDVLSAIKGVASSYMHPFSDYSTIPTYYLMNQIKDIYPNGGILIDGTGADGCFGFDLLTYSFLWKVLYAQPRFIKQIGRVLYDGGGMYKRTSKLRTFFSVMASSCERDIQLSPLVLSPIESLFTKQTRSCAQDVSSAFLKMFSSCMDVRSYNNSFYPKATVGDILNACRLMALKTFRVGREPLIDVVYPLLWKDVLVESGKLSWNCKFKNGTVKYPLKKLLEEHMAQEFIYRKKSGFTPPLLNWLLQKDVYNFMCDVLLNPDAFISNEISTEKIQKLIHGLQIYKSASGAVLHYLWGALFTELWLEENYKNFNFQTTNI